METLILLAALAFPLQKPDQTTKMAAPDQVKQQTYKPDQTRGASTKSRPRLCDILKRVRNR